MMNRRSFLRTGVAALIVGTLALISPSAHAQGIGGFLNSPMGAQINDMVQKGRQLPGLADPGICNAANLLTRTDVRNHLFLNGRQTEALGEMQGNYLPAMATQIMTVVQTMFQGANLTEMSPEDQKAYFADMGTKMADKMQETITTFQADQDKKAEAVLKPDQIKRLHELDLQWRGPLALTDATVNEPFQLTADQKAKLAAMLKEFRTTQQTARGAFMGMGGGRPGLTGAAPGAPAQGGASPTPPAKGTPDTPAPATGDGQSPPALNLNNFRMPSAEEMNTMLYENNKKMVKLRKVVDEKALALLTPEQQQKWKAVQGKPFAFRANP